jgi:hypothetical protein
MQQQQYRLVLSSSSSSQQQQYVCSTIPSTSSSVVRCDAKQRPRAKPPLLRSLYASTADAASLLVRVCLLLLLLPLLFIRVLLLATLIGVLFFYVYVRQFGQIEKRSAYEKRREVEHWSELWHQV